MSKLINLQVLEAKNVICASVVSPTYKTKNNEFWDNIEDSTARRDYIIPSHIIVGVFDDGTTRVAGIENLNVLNKCPIDSLNQDEFYNYGIFYYDTILYKVGLCEVKAFARYCYGENDNIPEYVKRDIYEDLLKSGVKIEDEAKEYLIG